VNYQVSPSLDNPSNDAFSPPICNHGIDENAQSLAGPLKVRFRLL